MDSGPAPRGASRNDELCWLRLEIRDLGRGREQPAVRRPQLAALVAIALVKDFGVSDGENLADIFGRKRGFRMLGFGALGEAPLGALPDRLIQQIHNGGNVATLTVSG